MKLFFLLSFFVLVSCSYFQTKNTRGTATAIDCTKKMNKQLEECSGSKVPEYRGNTR
ncbi:MAG: hypothetical protein JNM93_13995 [Bacteriovoracaceae bacterium]|nr:hypothetical protein [Bacteriovoracaceae bacterium]